MMREDGLPGGAARFRCGNPERSGRCGQELTMVSADAASEQRASARRAAAALMYRSHVDAVWGYVARRLGRDLASDVVAETFRIAIENLDQFDPERGSQRAWIYGIATNQVRRHWRTESRRLRATARHASGQLPAQDEAQHVAERLDAADETERLHAAVGNLSPQDRDLLVLVGWEGCPHHEVASILGIPPGTVRSRLHRIRAALRADIRNSTTRSKHDE